MLQRLALFFSAVGHPLFMPVFSLIILFSLNTYISQVLPLKFQLMVLGLLLVNTCILPVVFIVVMAKNKLISSVYLSQKNERVLPFLMAFVFYGFTYYLLKKAGLPKTINAIMLGATIAIFASVVVNLFYKLSIHMVGVSGVFGAFYALSSMFGLQVLWLLLFLIIAAGIIGTSRLILNQHTPLQILVGFAVGFFAEFFTIYFGLG